MLTLSNFIGLLALGVAVCALIVAVRADTLALVSRKLMQDQALLCLMLARDLELANKHIADLDRKVRLMASTLTKR